MKIPSSLTRTHFLYEALSYRGYPSVHYSGEDRGRDQSGFDCSGFIVFLLEQLMIPVPSEVRHCNELFDSFGVLIHPELAKPGDLVFISRDGVRPTHVGVMVNEEKYLHAPGKDGTKVCIESIPTNTLEPRSDSIYNVNPIGFKRISISCGRWKKLL